MVVLQQRSVCVWIWSCSYTLRLHCCCCSVCSALRKTVSDSNQLFPASHRSAAHTHTRRHTRSRRRQQTHTHAHTQTRSRRRQGATHTHIGGNPISCGKQHSLNLLFNFPNSAPQIARFWSRIFFDMRHWGVRRRLGARKRAWLYFNRDSSGGRRNRKHGLQKVALKAWNISWCRQRRCRPYSSSRRRRRMLSGVSAGL